MSENQTSNREKSRAINPNHDEIFIAHSGHDSSGKLATEECTQLYSGYFWLKQDKNN